MPAAFLTLGNFSQGRYHFMIEFEFALCVNVVIKPKVHSVTPAANEAAPPRVATQEEARISPLTQTE